MELWDAIKSRRTVRSFLKKPVPRSLIEKVIDAARYAPSSCNEQLWRFIVVESENVRNRIINECGTSSLILSSPSVIFVFYHNSRFPDNIESASAAVENILLAATAEGLATAWIGHSGNEAKLRKILNVSDDFVLICEILIGYSDKKPAMPPRKQLSEILFFEKDISSEIPKSHNPEKWSIREIAEHQRYFCRKTEIGKEVMVVSDKEKKLVNSVIKKYAKGKLLDILSYDGTFLGEFPEKSDLGSIELSKETADYIKKKRNVNVVIDSELEFKKLADSSYDTLTSFFKFECLPKKNLKRVFYSAKRILRKGGKFIIVYRKKFSLYGLIFSLIRLAFKDDIRKSGIFAFFGPYQPASGFGMLLKQEGFKVKEYSRYLIPPALENYYLLFLQYAKTGGNTYLDRKIRPGFFSKTIRFFVVIFSKVPFCGSIGVIIAEK
jgi:nitroreductase